MGTDMRMVVQAVSGTNGSWYALGDLLPERNYDAYAWYGRLGTGPVGGLSALALRGLPDDEEPAQHADRFADELGYGHSWCYLDELQREHARPAVVEQWVKRLLSEDLGKSVTNRDPETVRLVWSFAY